MSHFYSAGPAIIQGMEDSNRIKPEQGQVIQVIPADFLALQVSMYQPQSPQAAGPGTQAADLRDFHLVGIPDYNIPHVSVPGQQYPDLTPCLQGYADQVIGQFLGNHLLRVHLPSKCPL